MRFTHALIVVLAALTILVMVPIAAVMIGFVRLDDEFYPASSTPIEQSWPVASSPKIVVDNFDGSIWVDRSSDGKVSASVEKFCLCKNLSFAVAEDSLRFVRVEMAQDGNTIRIVGRPTKDRPINDFAKTGTYINVEARIRISVPDGSRLDLKSGSGTIRIVGRPDEIRAQCRNGSLEFDLDVPGGSNLKINAYAGEEAEIKFDGKGYTCRGVAR